MLVEDLSPVCSKCGQPATTVILLHGRKGLRFQYAGICAGNGNGDPVSAKKANAIRKAFSPPYTSEKFRLADLWDEGGFCRECGKFYCFTHWHVSSTGGGWCPKGHFKRLDPHWSPDD